MAVARLDRVRGRVSIVRGVEAGAMSQDAPCGSGQFVRQRNGRLVVGHSGNCSAQPGAKAECRPSVRAHHDALRRLNEQRSQISATPFADPSKDGSTAGAELAWHQSNPCGEVPAMGKGFALADRGDQRGRDHWADAGDRHDVRAILLGFADFHDLCRDRVDPLV